MPLLVLPCLRLVAAGLALIFVLSSWPSVARASPGDDELVTSDPLDPPAGRAGSAWLSLVGFTRGGPGEARESGAMLVLGLPLDRLARPAAARGARGLAEPAVVPSRAGPPPPATPAAPPLPDVDVALALSPRLARACVAAAWRAAGLGADDRRLDAIVSRARWSGLLPEARLRVIRADDERLYAESTPERTRDSASSNVGLEARLTWRLDRLLFSEEETSFERVRLDRQDARARVAGRVLEALFRWQRALLETRTTPKEVEPALRVAEAEALLDVLTAGWFSTWLVQRRVLVVSAPPPTGRGGDGE